MLELAGNVFIHIIGGIFLSALAFALFFIWLNVRNAQADKRGYESFDPEHDFARNIARGEEPELDPAKALKAYAQPATKHPNPREEESNPSPGPEKPGH